MNIRLVDTVGFTYQGEHLCLSCTQTLAGAVCIVNKWLTIGEAKDENVHELVSVWAAREAIPAYARGAFHTYDTSIFDSKDLPKAFEDAEDDEFCDGCGGAINGQYGA